MRPILSIVIPTKNRYNYLQDFVGSFVSYDSPELNLIIQDNSDIQSSEFMKFLNDLNDGRIIYNYSSGWMSVCDNCDLGIDLATGEYICMLGDDDGILFNVSLEVIKWIKKKDWDAAIVNKAEYYWPDTKHAVWKDLLSGSLFYKNYTNKIIQLDPDSELKKVLELGAANTLGLMPRVYHGFVKKEALLKLKLISGSYFPGPSPDMANAIGLSRVIRNYGQIDIPAVISGHSKKSTGGMGGEKKHHGRIEDQVHLPKNTVELWSEKIPMFWSGATIYAESARMALELTNSPENYKLNYPYLWAFCLIFESHYSRKTIPIIIKYPLQYFAVFYQLISIFSFRVINFLKNYMKFNKKTQLSFKASSISNAQEKLHLKLSEAFNISELYK
jgi:glycosyltransferase involved in cell wall biosynthesis